MSLKRPKIGSICSYLDTNRCFLVLLPLCNYVISVEIECVPNNFSNADFCYFDSTANSKTYFKPGKQVVFIQYSSLELTDSKIYHDTMRRIKVSYKSRIAVKLRIMKKLSGIPNADFKIIDRWLSNLKSAKKSKNKFEPLKKDDTLLRFSPNEYSKTSPQFRVAPDIKGIKFYSGGRGG